MHADTEMLYLREILIQADYARVALLRMNELGGQNEPELFFREAHAFVSKAAAISRILWPPRGLSDSARDKASMRASHLRRSLGISESHPLRSRQLRDHLEHLDERLDQWAEEKHSVLVDLCIGPEQQLLTETKAERRDLFRVYDQQKRRLIFRSDSFDIEALAEGVAATQKVAGARLDELIQASSPSTVE